MDSIFWSIRDVAVFETSTGLTPVSCFKFSFFDFFFDFLADFRALFFSIIFSVVVVSDGCGSCCECGIVWCITCSFNCGKNVFALAFKDRSWVVGLVVVVGSGGCGRCWNCGIVWCITCCLNC